MLAPTLPQLARMRQVVAEGLSVRAQVEGGLCHATPRGPQASGLPRGCSVQSGKASVCFLWPIRALLRDCGYQQLLAAKAASLLGTWVSCHLHAAGSL